jgi:DoxX-like protein
MTAHAISTAMETRTMQPQTTSISKARILGGRILSTVAVLFLVMDGGMKLFKPPFVVQATVQLGYPESTIVGIGVALLLCTALYLIPRTAVWGAILLTGYLGGAVASNVRAGTPMFNVAFPVLLGVVVWAALVLRDKRLERIFFAGE